MKVAVVLLMFVACSAFSQGWLSEGYQMSAMSYDSLGFHLKLDDQGAHSRSSFERVLLDDCANILLHNGIKCTVSKDDQRIKRYPCIVIELTIMPVERESITGDEFYYGALSFTRQVTVDIARRPWKAVGSTWSMTFGGQAKSRFQIIADLEERFKDFVEDYLKLNTAVMIWK